MEKEVASSKKSVFGRWFRRSSDWVGNNGLHKMRKIIILLLLLLAGANSEAQLSREILEFELEGVVLHGVLNVPDIDTLKGIVLIVHGSGRTDAVAQEWYYDVREAIAESGYATYMWDKMGCGKSGGTFNYNQSVQNSALEVIAAIQTLQRKQLPGSDKIGLWGISRAGWINPIVINQYKDIKFWISVSGVDDQENFKYLLNQNLKINGHLKDTIDLLVGEWAEGAKICHSGGSYEAYLAATQNLRQNDFMSRFTNGEITEAGYYQYQQVFMQATLDEETGLQVYMEDFGGILSSINCPVLALFGERDMNVDWIKTKTLYEKTLALNTDLTIRSFPDCNHNMFQCETGGFYEMQDNDLPWIRCNGFLDAMRNWLMAIE